MLKTAEDLAGPYVWGHYDILVLPPSFPYGGMENPCLTFATPTVLVLYQTPEASVLSGLVSSETDLMFCVSTGRRQIARQRESDSPPTVDAVSCHLFMLLLFFQVIAHEISHSWTGNLVTNKTWEHFW